MKKNKQNKIEIKIAYIGGGSTGWAKKLMSDLLMQEEMSGVLSLYDIDHVAAARNKRYFEKMMIVNQEHIQCNWQIEVAETVEECMVDSTFIVMSITPGELEHMGNDLSVPLKYGIYQSVGDTVGIGGYSRALRTLPIYFDYAIQIKKYAPDAWVINYTNPMTLATQALYEGYPEIKAFGCCHEVFKSQKLLIEAYKDYSNNPNDIPRNSAKVTIQGINHFTWISEASYNDVDLMESYKLFVDKYQDVGYDLDKDNAEFKAAMGTFREKLKSLERVKMNLFNKYNIMAAAGDRHLAEFIPRTYLIDENTVNDWDFKLTLIEDRYSNQFEKIKYQKEVIDGSTKPLLEPTDEEGVILMKALLGIEDFKTNVNLPNVNQLPDLPNSAIVETNAFFTQDSVVPEYSGKIKKDVLDLILVHVNNQLDFMKAYVNRDINGIIEVFCNEPSASHLKRRQVIEMVEELVILNQEFLEDWVINGMKSLAQ